MATKTRVAVLDDYQGVAAAHFASLDDGYETTVFRDTLLPYNHPDTPDSVRDELAKRFEPFHVVCTMRERTPFPRELIARLPNLKLLLTTSHRNASLDVAACKERGIPVAGAVNGGPESHKAGSASTTEHTVALILGLARNLAAEDRSVRTGGWQTGFATGLYGQTLGVVGLGRLGANVARIMSVAFRMKVIAWSANLTQDIADRTAKEVGLPAEDTDGEKTFKVVSKEELFSSSDVVSLHLVLSERSRGIVAKTELEMMKPSALFVNTSRGPLVVEKDLLNVLNEGKIRGAAIDVFELEPLPLDSAWRTTKWGEDGRSQVLLTPHTGYCEEWTINEWIEKQVVNIRRWKEGKELNDLISP